VRERPKLKFREGRNGRGVVLEVRLPRDAEYPDAEYPVALSYTDAARALFQLKDFLRASETGRRCVDAVHEERRREEAARAA
jgi:hypothetical protein